MNKRTRNIEFVTVPGYDCYCNALCNCNLYFGGHISEVNYSFAAGIKSIYYDKVEKKIFMNTHKCITIFVKDLGVSYIKDVKFTREKAREYITNLLNNKKVVLCGLKSTLVKYRKNFRNTNPVHHFVVILDYDADSKDYYISDGYVANEKENIYEGWIQEEDLFIAWEATLFYHIIYGKENAIEKDYDELAYNNFVLTIDAYLSSNQDERGIFGEEAVREFISELSVNDDIMKIITELKLFGFITSKRYIKQMLHKQEKYKIEEEEYGRIIDKWDLFCLKLLKVCISNNYSRLEKCKQLAFEIMKEEHDCLLKIKEINRTM